MLADRVDPFDERLVVCLCVKHHAAAEAWLRAQSARRRAFRR